MSFEFPEPLWEANFFDNKPCLVCGNDKAVSVLRTIETEIAPICKNCSCNWNFYGYNALKKVKPKQLIFNLIKFKLKHPFCGKIFTIYKDLKKMQAWAAKMKRIMKKYKSAE
jgi:hypothetical protein